VDSIKENLSPICHTMPHQLLGMKFSLIEPTLGCLAIALVVSHMRGVIRAVIERGAATKYERVEDALMAAEEDVKKFKKY
jgi:hypothetical protein